MIAGSTSAVGDLSYSLGKILLRFRMHAKTDVSRVELGTVSSPLLALIWEESAARDGHQCAPATPTIKTAESRVKRPVVVYISGTNARKLA